MLGVEPQARGENEPHVDLRERLLEVDAVLPWAENIWMGVSIENAAYIHRIDRLRATTSMVKFLSLEPLLGPPELDLGGIDWVIVGGKSGPRCRPIDIRDQCLAAGVPFFFKQWGGWNKKKNGRTLEGRIWDEMPQLLHQSA